MAFPTSPTNGQQTTQNGLVYTWNSTLGVWALTTSTTGAISATSVTATANITGGNILTSGLISATGNLTAGGVASITGNVNIGSGTGVTWANAGGVRVWTYYNNSTSSLDTLFL